MGPVCRVGGECARARAEGEEVEDRPAQESKSRSPVRTLQLGLTGLVLNCGLLPWPATEDRESESPEGQQPRLSLTKLTTPVPCITDRVFSRNNDDDDEDEDDCWWQEERTASGFEPRDPV